VGSKPRVRERGRKGIRSAAKAPTYTPRRRGVGLGQDQHTVTHESKLIRTRTSARDYMGGLSKEEQTQ